MLKLIDKVKAASTGGKNLEFLTPYMTSEEYAPGQVLFNKGDKADKIYFIKEGNIVLPEFQKQMSKGATLGEVGIFTPDNVRACSAVASDTVEALTITSEKVLQLYYQNPTFGFFLIRTIAEIASKSSSQKIGMVIALDDLETSEKQTTDYFEENSQQESPKEEKISFEPNKQSIKTKMDFHVEGDAIYFFGDLYWKEINTQEKELQKLKELNEKKIIDISNIYNIDSSGIGLLISIASSIKNSKLKTQNQIHEINNSGDIINVVMDLITTNKINI